MSLILTDASLTAKAAQDDADPEARQDLARLTRYLAILEDNKKASRFVPDDEALALDGRFRTQPAVRRARRAGKLSGATGPGSGADLP